MFLYVATLFSSKASQSTKKSISQPMNIACLSSVVERCRSDTTASHGIHCRRSSRTRCDVVQRHSNGIRRQHSQETETLLPWRSVQVAGICTLAHACVHLIYLARFLCTLKDMRGYLTSNTSWKMISTDFWSLKISQTNQHYFNVKLRQVKRTSMNSIVK